MALDILPLLDIKSSISKPYITKDQFKQTRNNIPNNNMLLDGYMLNKDLKFIKKIGAGTYGLIYLVENIYTHQRFAAKMLLKQPPFTQGDPKDSQLNKKLIQQQFYQYFYSHNLPKPTSMNLNYIRDQGHDCQFLTEISLHLKAHEHPNITTIHQVYDLDNFAIIILMDYFEQGDLFNNIIDKQIFQKHRFDRQILMKNAMLQLIDAVEYCHQLGIYHCDLKPENIMVEYNPYYQRSQHSSIIDYKELRLSLIDFGLALDTNLICCNACRGSSFYMAPERTINFNTNKIIKSLIDMSQFQSVYDQPNTNLSNCKYLPTLPGDVWSLGVLFINITCSRNPWPIASLNDNSNDVFKNYILNNNHSILSSILPISSQFNKLLDKIFKLNPNDRIDLINLYKEVIRCDFFKDDHHHSHHHHRHRNQQLYTPPETTAYNSYVSDFDEDDEEFYTDDEEIEYDEYQQDQITYQTKQQQPFYKENLQKFALETPSNSIVY
ncbi:unnamed protein product [Candida verbasci]|uniref:Protein kinase domain-containing protein n=1 Tax=Candida verbasci TaxID=1227364 RepID=A0A9W4TXX0_9ASCO|nr:unnamed protein product [Candida verbasci]